VEKYLISPAIEMEVSSKKRFCVLWKTINSICKLYTDNQTLSPHPNETDYDDLQLIIKYMAEENFLLNDNAIITSYEKKKRKSNLSSCIKLVCVEFIVCVFVSMCSLSDESLQIEFPICTRRESFNISLNNKLQSITMEVKL
jgi:hypothetical protein